MKEWEREEEQQRRQGLINAGAGLVVLILMAAIGLSVVYFINAKDIDISDAGDIVDTIIELSLDCDGWREEKEAGERCEASDDCVMTGTEFKAFSEAKSKYLLNCDSG